VPLRSYGGGAVGTTRRKPSLPHPPMPSAPKMPKVRVVKGPVEKDGLRRLSQVFVKPKKPKLKKPRIKTPQPPSRMPRPGIP
jgi:hypothetical protein